MTSQSNLENIILSEEQELFVRTAKEGKNILVDACIGSGKTTAIQYLCNELPTSMSILYLTYNRLLKLDAQSKIKNANVHVTNYHGFASKFLSYEDYHVGVSDLIQFFLFEKPSIPDYDLLIIDEYQDIEQEHAELVEYIKSLNPQMQIIAVGDMEQKIYDKTELDAAQFINNFLGDDFVRLEFTQCFRLSAGIADMLGRVWHKKILGVNENCCVETMSQQQVIDFLGDHDPQDILCLGARMADRFKRGNIGQLTTTLNMLEMAFPYKFNKKTVYASIRDEDGYGTAPNPDSAIFTTFDSSKGLERKICVVFDFTEKYWRMRSRMPLQKYSILRNIFCVACSRGKEHIIFVEDKNEQNPMLAESTLATPFETTYSFRYPFNMSNMFEHKYIENVEACFQLLDIHPLPVNDTSSIYISRHDCLIDLSPCVGNYQEPLFFEKNSPDKTFDFWNSFKKSSANLESAEFASASFDEKILRITAKETGQDRYVTQVEVPFVPSAVKEAIVRRLSTRFQPDENVQVRCSIPFSDEPDGHEIFRAIGMADVVKDNVVYELKFVSDLTHNHFLQCACYMIGLNLEKGILWNTRNNQQFEIHIPDRQAFMDAVVVAITKKQYAHYYKPAQESVTTTAPNSRGKNLIPDLSAQYPTAKESTLAMNPRGQIAVIDAKINSQNEVMSFGIVIADIDTLQPVSEIYYILENEAARGGVYSGSLLDPRCISYRNSSRADAISEILPWLRGYHVQDLFAYNAPFNYRYFPELSEFAWYDIMRIAAYRQHNDKIPDNAELCSTGKLKHNFGIEPMMRLLSGSHSYNAVHNAICDARDELMIMRLLDLPVSAYECARLYNGKIKEPDEYIPPEKETLLTMSYDDNDIPISTRSAPKKSKYRVADEEYSIQNWADVIRAEFAEKERNFADIQFFESDQEQVEISKLSHCASDCKPDVIPDLFELAARSEAQNIIGDNTSATVTTGNTPLNQNPEDLHIPNLFELAELGVSPSEESAVLPGTEEISTPTIHEMENQCAEEKSKNDEHLHSLEDVVKVVADKEPAIQEKSVCDEAQLPTESILDKKTAVHVLLPLLVVAALIVLLYFFL